MKIRNQVNYFSIFDLSVPGIRLVLCIVGVITLLLNACTTKLPIAEGLQQRFAQNEIRQKKVMKGIDWYACLGRDKILDRPMSLNVIDIDLKKARVNVDFAWFNASSKRATLSEVADTSLAIVAVNSAYFEKLDKGGFVSFHKSEGIINQRVELPENHTRFWKHQAAFTMTNTQKFGIIQGNQHLYEQLDADNVVSSAPLLIANGIPVGKHFVVQKTGDKSDLPREHPDRHQAGWGPRTAFALTQNHHLLLVCVDGRSAQANGINASELTVLLSEALYASDAINMDGGGSVTLFVRGASPTGIVNYPSDLRKIDPDRLAHQGQRRIGMALLVKPTHPKVLRKMKEIRVFPDQEAKDYHDSSNQKKPLKE